MRTLFCIYDVCSGKIESVYRYRIDAIQEIRVFNKITDNKYPKEISVIVVTNFVYNLCYRKLFKLPLL